MFDDFQDMDEEMVDGAHGSFSEPEGLELPRHSDFFVGHESVEQRALNLINSGAMPHAIILAGQKGIGKATFAYRLARCLFKNGTADSAQDSLFGDAPAEITSLSIAQDDPVFSKVAAGGHPDLLTIERPIDAKKGTQKNNIDVDTARKVAPFLRMTSADGGWRIVIVDDADTMNRNAQNALLKILEEPPSNALLILVTHRLGSMIPTIRSRCRTIHFDPLNEAEISALMTRAVGGGLPKDEQDLLNFLSEGSIGRAQHYLQTETLQTAQKTLNVMESYPNFNFTDIHHLTDSVSPAGQEEGFKAIESTFNAIFSALVFAKARGQNDLKAPINHNVYKEMLSRYSLHDLTQKCDEVRTHFSQANFANLGKKQAVIGAFNIINQ